MEQEEVAAAEVDTGFLDEGLACPVFRKGVSYSYVLQTQIRHISQIAGLRIVVVATIGNTRYSTGTIIRATIKTWITVALVYLVTGYGSIVRIPDYFVVTCLVRVDSHVGVYHSRKIQRGSCPVITLAYALEIEVEVDASPSSTQVEAIFVTRHGISDDFQVAVVAEGTRSRATVGSCFTAINYAVTVQVLELDIARAIMEVA